MPRVIADTTEYCDSGESELSFSFTSSDEDEKELIIKAEAAEQKIIQLYTHGGTPRTLLSPVLQGVQPRYSKTIPT